MALRSKRPMRRRGGLRKRRGLRKARLFRGVAASNRGVAGQTCVCKETYNAGALANNQSYISYWNGILPGTRAAAIAPNFALYRIARIAVKITPYFDTYAANNAAGNNPVAVPYFYWVVNRQGSQPAAFGAAYLRDCGAKPIRVDGDKPIMFSYKPNILQANLGTGTSGAVKMTPWLNTNQTVGSGPFVLDTTTQHFGHLMMAVGAAAGAANGNIANIEVSIWYQFKKPRGVSVSTSDVPPVVLPMGHQGEAELDLSGNIVVNDVLGH